jgi:hypothetical protein
MWIVLKEHSEGGASLSSRVWWLKRGLLSSLVRFGSQTQSFVGTDFRKYPSLFGRAPSESSFDVFIELNLTFIGVRGKPISLRVLKAISYFGILPFQNVSL